MYSAGIGAPEPKEAGMGDGNAGVYTLGLKYRLKCLDQEVFIEEVTIEPRPEGGKGMKRDCIHERNIQAQGMHKCKSPEARASWGIPRIARRPGCLME